MEKWTDRLTIDMIPEQYRQLAEITGIQPLLTLAATTPNSWRRSST